MTLLEKIKSTICGILELSDTVMTKILLYGDNTLIASSNNIFILNSSIDHVISTKRFDNPILTQW